MLLHIHTFVGYFRLQYEGRHDLVRCKAEHSLCEVRTSEHAFKIVALQTTLQKFHLLEKNICQNKLCLERQCLLSKVFVIQHVQFRLDDYSNLFCRWLSRLASYCIHILEDQKTSYVMYKKIPKRFHLRWISRLDHFITLKYSVTQKLTGSRQTEQNPHMKINMHVL